MDVPAYEIIFCISKTQYSLCRQHKCPLFHDIVFYAHYTSFAMRCQHNSTLFLLLWLVFLVDFCGFSLFLLRYQVKQKAFSDFHILISENAKKNCHIRFLQYSSFLIFLCKNTCTSFTAQWQCPPQLPQLPLQPFPLFLSFTMLLIARPAIATTIAPTTTVPILYSFPVTRNAFARDFCLLLQTLYKISPTNIIMIYIVSIF